MEEKNKISLRCWGFLYARYSAEELFTSKFNLLQFISGVQKSGKIQNNYLERNEKISSAINIIEEVVATSVFYVTLKLNRSE